MKIIFTSIVIILYSNLLYSINIEGIVIDNSTKKPINEVHIYALNNLKTGTISNSNGEFSIYLEQLDTLVFSHINYNTLFLPANYTSKPTIIIELQQNERVLSEITITSLSPLQIIEKSIKNLKDNHYVEPINYDFFTRFIEYKPDSVLNIIEEYFGNIYFKKNNNALFYFKNSRAKIGSLSNTDPSSRRMVGMSKMFIDNIFMYLDAYIHPRKHKNYEYKFEDDVILYDRPMYKIIFNTDKDTYYKSGYLIIDKETFAIAEKVLNPNKSYADKVVKFKNVENKWYLSLVKETHHSNIGNFISERITLYNISTKPVTNDYLPTGLVMTQKTKKFIPSFENDYWEESNYIKLPEWLKKQL